MKKITFIIKDMHCSNCAMLLESLEDKLPGIKAINASYRKGSLEVEFDPALISEGEIMAAIERLGYHVGK